ncbi:MAG: lysylphosphatidylglycerol synthase transmembrane domain-containing protein [Rickettsiales bacterium]
MRFLVTLGAAYLALSQVELGNILPQLLSIVPFFLLAALAATHIGQGLSALRTRYYLHCQGIDLPTGPSLRLHYIGGLFNAFLPGGTGGDAYKAWWLKRHKQAGMLNMVKLMIATRLNGMWALGLLLCAMALFSAQISNALPYPAWSILLAAALGTAGYMLLAHFFLKEPWEQQFRALSYSLSIQLLQAATAYLICMGLGQQDNILEYVILFMLSCMLAMLPISIGGIGVRELALLQGSRILHLSEESGVALAFTYTILSLTIPLVGAIVHIFYAPRGEQAAYEIR